MNKPPVYKGYKDPLLKDLQYEQDRDLDEFIPFNMSYVKLQIRIMIDPSKWGLVARVFRQVKRVFDKHYIIGNATRFAAIPKHITKSGKDEVICLSTRRAWDNEDKPYTVLQLGIRRIPMPKIPDTSKWLYYVDKAIMDGFYMRLEMLMRKDGVWDDAPEELKQWIIDKGYINKL